MNKDLATMILESRYFRKNEKGMETKNEMFYRVAKTLASNHKDENIKNERLQLYYDVMKDNLFLPNSPTLMNAGTDLGNLMACFVLPIEDSMVSIFDTLKNAAIIHKSGGGTGFDFSKLRPEGDDVKTTQGVSSGPVSFLTAYDAATETVKQGSKRRGANMGILRIDHPDIEKFITCKQDNDKINNFNLSVGITDKFMEAVISNHKYFDLINPRTGDVEKVINPIALWDMIVDSAWLNGEPGLLFLDEVNRHNPTPEQGDITATNPCGEQPLLPYEACCLGSINLSEMINDGKVNYIKLTDTVKIATQMLNDIIDVNVYPLPEIETVCKRNRKIGLGVMGWADMLIKLGIPYDSERALSLAKEIIKNIRNTAGKISQNNATLTTIAPTGTISIIAGCSSGIEPMFAVVTERRQLDTVTLDVNPLFEKIAKEHGFYSEELIRKIAKTGSVQGLSEVPNDIQGLFKTANEISPEAHVKMQAVWQVNGVDNAVSKTVNLPNSASKDDVNKIFRLAWELKCKGITVYRDGSRVGQVLSSGKQDDKHERIKDRPKIITGSTMATETPLGKLFLTLNNDENGAPFETFAQIGKAGSDVTAFTEAIARLISLALRSGVNITEIIPQLIGIGGNNSIGFGNNRILSVPDAIGKALKTLSEESIENESFDKQICPECGVASIAYQEGCLSCTNCGYSRC